MMFRGMCKVVAIAFVTNQILTTLFTYLARQLDAALPDQALWLFSCVTCGLLTLWLQSDARRAFGFAREKGFKELDVGRHVVHDEDFAGREDRSCHDGISELSDATSRLGYRLERF